MPTAGHGSRVEGSRAQDFTGWEGPGHGDRELPCGTAADIRLSAWAKPARSVTLSREPVQQLPDSREDRQSSVSDSRWKFCADTRIPDPSFPRRSQRVVVESRAITSGVPRVALRGVAGNRSHRPVQLIAGRHGHTAKLLEILYREVQRPSRESVGQQRPERIGLFPFRLPVVPRGELVVHGGVVHGRDGSTRVSESHHHSIACRTSILRCRPAV
jgi:hypothetical protein